MELKSAGRLGFRRILVSNIVAISFLLFSIISCKSSDFTGTYLEEPTIASYRDTLKIVSDSTFKLFRSYGLSQKWVYGNIVGDEFIVKDSILIGGEISESSITTDTLKLKSIRKEKLVFSNGRIFIRSSSSPTDE